MIKPPSLDDIALFVEVARTGSFTKASANLGIPGGTLSRRIATMERLLGVRLFDRTTRRVEVTEPARRYFDRCAHLIDEAKLASEVLGESAALPSGHVRVSLPVDLGIFWIAPLLPEFGRKYPKITLDLDLSPKYANLVGDRIDVAIRIGQPNDELLISKKIGDIQMGLYAAPSYLGQRGLLKRVTDLSQHDCIHRVTHSRKTPWTLAKNGQSSTVDVSGRVVANNIGMLLALAEGGMGVAMLPSALVKTAVIEGRLIPVLQNYHLDPLPVFSVISSRMQTAAVRAFLDYLSMRLIIDL